MIEINNMTPDVNEAIRVSGKAVGLPVLDYLADLKEAWTKSKGSAALLNTFQFMCLLSTAFTAGYMQGKREERTQQAQRKAREGDEHISSNPDRKSVV